MLSGSEKGDDLGMNVIACHSVTGPPLPASKTASISSKPAAVPTNSQKCVMPNINIINADKRLQIMKKKAAKMQEKRKHSK